MSDDRLPIELIISGKIREAAREGIPITIVRRGDKASGTILLKINRLDGTAHLLSQVRIDDTLAWCPLTATDPMQEKEADQLMHKQASYDPDVWLIEIEDRQGRQWFEGKRVAAFAR